MLRWARRRRTLAATAVAGVAAACAVVAVVAVHLTGGGASSVSAAGAGAQGGFRAGPRGVLTPTTEPTTVSTVSPSVAAPVGSAPALVPTRAKAMPVAPQRWAYLVLGSPHRLVAYDLATGVSHPIGPGDSPTLSPDRSRLAFVGPDAASGALVVRVAGAGGSAPHPVSDPATLSAGYCLAWSPAGGLAFVAAPRGSSVFDIFLAGPHGVVRLTTGAHVTGCSPQTRALAWSGDGRRLVFVSDQGSGQAVVEVVDVSTAAVREVTRPADGGFGSPSWLPVGQELVAQRSDDKLVTIDVPTGQVSRITTGSADERAPAVSGYGGWVSYLRSGATALVRLNGTGVRALSPADGSSPAATWSSDGTAVLFTRRTAAGDYTAFTRVAAGSPTVVIHRGDDYYATW